MKQGAQGDSRNLANQDTQQASAYGNMPVTKEYRGEKLTLPRILNRALAYVCIVLSLCLLGYYIYSWIDTQLILKDSSSQKWAQYKPNTSDPLHMDFRKLQQINPDICAWINIYGTEIDYPVAQAADNMKYINLGPDGKTSFAGCPFLDWQNARDFSDFCSIIYAHHMDVPAMFGELDRFEKPDYFEEHKYGKIFFDERWWGLSIFAFSQANAYDNNYYQTSLVGNAAKQAYLQLVKDGAKQFRQLDELGPDDHIVMLSTCARGATDARYQVFAKITDTVEADPWAKTRPVYIVDLFPPWPWWGIAAFVLLAAAVVLLAWLERRDRPLVVEILEPEGSALHGAVSQA